MSDLNAEIAAMDEHIPAIENQFLQEILSCTTTQQVETAVTYARYLNHVGLNAENYPVFLRMLDIENHWVIDALIGSDDPATLLSRVQPNEYIVGRIITMVRQWRRGGIFTKNLGVILGVLRSVYQSPREGLKVHRLTLADVNAIAKHLNKETGPGDSVNRAILDLLDRLAELTDSDDSSHSEIGVHASEVKNAFLDDRKTLEDVIPSELLAIAADRNEDIADTVRLILSAPKGDRTICIHFIIDEADIETNLRHPGMMVGSDGIPTLNGKPHPRLFGTFPRLLGEYVRSRGVLSLEDAIARITSISAETFGLKERGRIEPGYHADIVLFDPDTIADTATYDDPKRLSHGISLVIVNGAVAWSDGVYSGAGSGQMLRYRRDSYVGAGA